MDNNTVAGSLTLPPKHLKHLLPHHLPSHLLSRGAPPVQVHAPIAALGSAEEQEQGLDGYVTMGW